MKAYERVNVEVVKFEAQDVITASVAAPVECVCDHNCYSTHMGLRGNDNGEVDHTRVYFDGEQACYADEHPNCVEVEVN